jgi:hypothetical protein
LQRMRGTEAGGAGPDDGDIDFGGEDRHPPPLACSPRSQKRAVQCVAIQGRPDVRGPHANP